MHRKALLVLYFSLLACLGSPVGARAVERPAKSSEFTRLQNDTVRLTVAGPGGAIVGFQFLDNPVNPLNWSSSPQEDPDQKGTGIVLRGHFLCLDRWGAPSAAEQARGVPFHGEAPRVRWSVAFEKRAGWRQLKMACQMKLAQMSVQRTIQFGPASSKLTLVHVSETVTNTGKLGRIYNFVQHPSIAPPFLDDTTLVDSNADQGFLQMDNGAVPKKRSQAFRWPEMRIHGKMQNLRHFTGKAPTGHDVSSFRFRRGVKLGWVTACNPAQRLLIGYIWRTADYPWLNIWRYAANGKVQARGLEFGTTGLHQPFGVLVKTQQVLGQTLYVHIDAGQRVTKSYLMFLSKVPKDYRGVAGLSLHKGQILLKEHESRRQIKVATDKLGL